MMPAAPHQEREEELVQRLRDKGYRLTHQRFEIIRVLSGDTSHPGATELLQRVREKAPHISLSTVYYTLDMLKREGLVKELEFYDKDNRYDVNVSDHVNLVCRTCGKIEDYMADTPFSSAMIEEQTGFRPVEMRFEYYGYCANCRGKQG
jgi:Fe2+ or Zn2+ uptake regulation protein